MRKIFFLFFFQLFIENSFSQIETGLTVNYISTRKSIRKDTTFVLNYNETIYYNYKYCKAVAFNQFSKNGVIYDLYRDGKIYSIDTIEKIIIISSAGKSSQITEINETDTILGYKCTKFFSIFTHSKGCLTSYFWIANQFKIKNDLGIKYLRENKGLLLKMETNHKLNDGTVFKYIGIATSIKKEKLSDSIFDIPKNYRIKYQNIDHQIQINKNK